MKILGIVLCEVPKTPIAWEKVATQFKYHIDSIHYIPDDYIFGSNTLHAAIISSLWYGEDKTHVVAMGNVLQAIALFNNQKVPTDVVKVAWCCLQAPGANGYFDSSLRKLVHLGLVEETRRFAKDGKEYFHELEIHDLVREFVLMEMGSVNMTSLMEEEEVKGREKVLILLLMIYGGKEVREYAIAQVPSLSYLPLNVETDSPKVSSLMTDFLTYGLVKALDLPAMEGHFSTPSPQIQDNCISEDWQMCESNLKYPKITKIQQALEMTQDKSTSKPSVTASNLHGVNVPDIERSDAVSNSIDFELGGDVGVGTLQSQATSKFAEHCTVLRITEVFDKVITSAQELLDSQNGGNSIKVVGRQDKTADAYEFFFQSAKCMSKVVGVGLEWAKVVVCMECGSVKVWSINESAWRDSWHQVEEGVVVLSIDLANIRKEGHNIYSLTAEEASKKFGVGVHPQGPDYNHGGVNAFFVEEKRKDVAFYPLIWELAHYMAWNCKQHAGSETRNSGAPPWWGNLGHTTSSQSQGSSSNNQAGDDAVDNSGAPANLCDVFSNVAIDPKKDKTLIVTVYLPDEKISNPQNMAESQLDDRIEDASISAELEFKFELLQGDTIRKITIETRTQCNLGKSAPKSRDRGYLGYYQDDITISLSCTGKKSDGSQAARLLNQVTIPNSKDKKWTECHTYVKSESCAKQKCGQITGQATVTPLHMATFGGSIQRGQNQTNTSQDSTSHASTFEVTIANCVSGYVVNPMEQQASWECNFLSEHNVLDYIKQGDDGAYKRLKSSGIFNTFWPSIVSLWGNLDDENVACPYEFNTKRDIISIQDEFKRRPIQAIQDHAQTPAFVPTPEPKPQHSWRFWSKKRTLPASQDFPVPEISTESQNLQQVYVKTMCVNIAMTHVIHEYKRLELRAQEIKLDTGITIGVQGPLQVNAETA